MTNKPTMSTGKTTFAWSTFKDVVNKCYQTDIQVIEFCNGEGLHISIEDKFNERRIDLSWEEWGWLVKTVGKLKAVQSITPE